MHRQVSKIVNSFSKMRRPVSLKHRSLCFSLSAFIGEVGVGTSEGGLLWKHGDWPDLYQYSSFSLSKETAVLSEEFENIRNIPCTGCLIY